MAEEKASVQEEKWDIVIKPKDKLLAVDFKELGLQGPMRPVRQAEYHHAV